MPVPREIPAVPTRRAADLTIAGGKGVETLRGGDGNDTIDGNGGNDLAFLGAGEDTFVWDPGDGSDVVEGQGGGDPPAYLESRFDVVGALPVEEKSFVFLRD